MRLSFEQKDLILYENYPNLWAFLKYHRTHNNTKATIIGYPYLKEIFLDRNKHIIIESSTQNGKTEFLIVNAIMDAAKGRGVFYVLPTFDIRNRFVGNRFNRTIDYTKYYQHLMEAEESSSAADSTSLKHFGKGSIAFIGSNSAAAFTEFPADTVIIDELDRCDQSNIGMAEERLSNSKDPRRIKVSNPTIKDFGIDYEYNLSDKKLWHIKCDSCGQWLHPNFFEHVVKDIGNNNYVFRDEEYSQEMSRDIFCICDKCNKPFDRFKNGKWIAQNPVSNISGYQINKIHSSRTTIKDLCDKFNSALLNPRKMERFYNADLGEAYTAKGAKIDFDMLNACKRDYFMPDKCSDPCVLGIDVGSKLHVIIGKIQPDKKIRLVYINELELNLKELKELFKNYNIKIGCIDALPEQNFSKQVCHFIGMFRCFIQETKKDTIDAERRILTIDRTTSLDMLKEEIMLENILLPKNADILAPQLTNGISQFYNMLCNSVRLFDEEKQKYKWVEGNKPDHYQFAMNFMLTAKKILLSM